MKALSAYIWTPRFANDVDALIPEKWAMEALLQLDNLLIMGKLVHRDFDEEIASNGNVVNAHRPSKHTARRKNVNSDIQTQDVNVENIPVKLDQHWYDSFIIRDGEESKAFKSLVELHLAPAMESIAQSIDRALHYEAYNFIQSGGVGELGLTADSTVPAALRKCLNQQAVPLDGRRYFVFNPCVEEAFLNIDKFITADKLGDDGTALREGTLGRKMGFWMIMSQNVPTVSSVNPADVEIGAVNNLAGYDKGDTVVAYDGGPTVVVGQWATIEGDNTPQKVIADSGLALTLAPGLQRAVADDAVITLYNPALVNNGAGYGAGYEEEIAVDGITGAIQSGQLVSQGVTATSPVYGAMDLVTGPSAVEVLPSRPLENAEADDAPLFLGPAGSYNLAFHRNAIALVTRPLALPRAETGVRGSVVNYEDISVRVVITYNAIKQGHVVTIDILGGIKVLDERMGCVYYSD